MHSITNNKITQFFIFHTSTIFHFSFIFFYFKLKSSDSAYTINRSNDNLLSSSEMLSKYAGGTTVTKGSHTGANGSVITMTMKNNHLIVETEERNVCWFPYFILNFFSKLGFECDVICRRSLHALKSKNIHKILISNSDMTKKSIKIFIFKFIWKIIE